MDVFTKAKVLNTFRKLMDIKEKYKGEVLDDPLHFLRLASEKLEEKDARIRELKLAAFPAPLVWASEAAPVTETFRTVAVTQEDYDCLMAVRAQFKT